jgi:pimeloyl-ACP methyl ester carboxylesterase
MNNSAAIEQALTATAEYVAPAISPDENCLAVAYRRAGQADLKIVDWPGGTGQDIPVVHSRELQRFWWAYNSKGLFYLADHDGNERKTLYFTDIHSGRTKDLTSQLGSYATLVAQFGSSFWVSVASDEAPHIPHLFGYASLSAEPVLLARNPGDVTRWVPRTDARGVLGICRQPGGLRWRGFYLGSQRWSDILDLPAEDTILSSPIRYTTTRILARSSLGADTARVVLYTTTGDRARVLAERERADVASISLNHRRQVSLVGFGGITRSWSALTQQASSDLRAIESAFNGLYLGPLTESRSGQLFTAVPTGGVPEYRMFNRRDGHVRTVLPRYPALSGWVPSPCHNVDLRARDGLHLSAIVTTPEGREAIGTVILVHGGPWHRDELGFDPLAQWIASLDLACVQVNYRGSTGFGKQFLNAGNGQWGLGMQHDVVDAMTCLLDKGRITDRLLVMGHSYGGYAALMIAATSPLPIRGAIAQSPITDLVGFLRWIRQTDPAKAAEYQRRIGDPAVDQASLYARSPVAHLDSLACPVLLAYGTQDARLPPGMVAGFGSRLRDSGKTVEILAFPDEGHQVRKRHNCQRLFGSIREFATRALSGRSLTESANASP